MLARLNKTLISSCAELLRGYPSGTLRIAFLADGGLCPRLQECLDVVWLEQGPARWGQIQDKFVKKFACHGYGQGFDAFKRAVEQDNKIDDKKAA